MKNKKVIYAFALGFSLLFSLLYFLVFHYYIPLKADSETLTLYMNQIGRFEKEKNALHTEEKIEKLSIETYIYKSNDLYVVVCGIGEEKTAKENGEKLKEMKYSYVLKKLEITDTKIISYVEAKNYEKALELIGNQSK